MEAICGPYFDELDEQRQENNDCDLILQVGNKIFPCHWDVLCYSSAYFKALFNENALDENNPTSYITLKEVDASTFEEILNAMYRGRIIITSQNVLRLLKSSLFLGISEIKKSCISFIENNMPIDQPSEELCTNLLNEGKLHDDEINYSAKHSIHTSNTYDLIVLPIPVFEEILSQKKLEKDDDMILKKIKKWTKRNSIHCFPTMDKILEIVGSSKMKIPYMQIGNKTDEYSYHAPAKPTLEITNQSTLKVYLKAKPELTKYSENGNNRDDITRLISLAYTPGNEDSKWTLVDTFCSTFINLKTVFIRQRQYFLAYYRDISGSNFCQFWSMKDEKLTILRKPPAIDESYELCVAKDHIFMYFTQLRSHTVNNLIPDWNYEDISIYIYNTDLDKWFSTQTTPMPYPVTNAAFVGNDFGLYLVGGHTHDYMNPSRTVQFLDTRCSSWTVHELGKNFCRGAACIYQNDIYLSGSDYGYGLGLTDSFLKFNITSLKTTTCKRMNKARANHHLVPFQDQLFVIENRYEEAFPSFLEKYQIKSGNWSDESPFPRKIASYNNILWTENVVATVVSPY